MADKEICKKPGCGKIHLMANGAPACRGHLSSDGITPCKKAPIAGGFVCRTHGGALTRTRVAAAERLAMMSAQGEIAELMRECDIPEQHPIDGLLEVVRVSGSMMRLLTIKVGELKEEPEVEEVLVESSSGDLGTRRRSSGDAFWGLNAQGEMAPHVYVNLLRMWTERYERACKTALEAGIEERRIRLAEDTSETFFAALGKAIAVAGLDPAEQAQLTKALANELRGNLVIEGETA